MKLVLGLLLAFLLFLLVGVLQAALAYCLIFHGSPRLALWFVDNVVDDEHVAPFLRGLILSRLREKGKCLGSHRLRQP